MKIFIDGIEADTDASTSVRLSLSIAEITDPEKSRTGYSKPFVLPATPRNRQLIGGCGDVNSAEAFNGRKHTARIEQDGCVIMDGTLYIAAYTDNGDGGGEYSAAIIGPGKEWVNKAAVTPLRKLELGFEEVISAATIVQSWSWDKPVRFLPVQRDSFAIENYNSHLFPPVKILSFEDYHPFIHIRTMIEAVFRSAGYAIESEFMRGGLFDSLYMSGNYPRKSIEGDKSKMDFLAGRFDDRSATANSTGKVYADPVTSLNTVGNIVETANPREESEGRVLENVFSKNDCFTKIGNRIAFVPTHGAVVGFEFKIHYTADYYMLDRDELKTFNKLYLWSGQEHDYKIVNSNTDRRNDFRTGKTFMVIIFGHRDGDSYQFRYDELANEQVDPDNPQPGEVTPRILTTFSTRTATITATGSKPVANPSIWIKEQGSSTYVAYESDWALYDGYVQERGETEVEITVRSSPERILPSQPKFFDQIYFGGAEPGMKFTLGRNTTLRPLFAGYPCEGSTVRFEDVAAHEASCLDLINAVRHMFNLAFFTDSLEKRVRIEPKTEFYKTDTIIDWSGKMDLSKPIRISEAGSGLPQTYTMRYQTGDGAVSRWNRQNGQRFGSHSWKIANILAKEGEKVNENPLFTASINVTGAFPDAPAASLVQAGDRETDTMQDVEELNFPAKVVRYMGMSQLPPSQKWGWPWYQGSYPSLVFHSAGTSAGNGVSTRSDGTDASMATGVTAGKSAGNGQDGSGGGFTMCFEDRDSAEGLHRFYDKTFDTYGNGKKVEVYISLSPHEIEPLVYPNSLGHDFSALYRLVINGENALYRLEQVCDYDPEEPSTKCIFIKEA